MRWFLFILAAWLPCTSSFFHHSSLHPSVIEQKVFQNNERGLKQTQRLFGRARKKSSANIVSPFDPAGEISELSSVESSENLPLRLTEENVELVLQELRPMLQADGGDVKLVEIDGNVVKVELCGNCVSCASSSMTLNMGIEKKLKQRIAGVRQVVQVMPDAPDVTESNVEKVLSGVRPFLGIAGGTVNAVRITKLGKGLPSVIVLKMEGNSKALHSVKLEIVQRLQKFFMQPMNIQWIEDD